MVAPEDIGSFAAALLNDERTGLFFIEGPQNYSYNDAADAFSKLMNKPVKALAIPKGEWIDFLTKGSFSDKAANSFYGMTELTIDQPFEIRDAVHGNTTLTQYLEKALNRLTEL